jgi:vacuolar-type H+-ATPase subunit H
MTEPGLLDIPAGQSMLPALARKEHELQLKIEKAQADAEAAVEKARKEAAAQVREEREKIPEEEKSFLDSELTGARERAEKMEKEGMAEVAAMRERVEARAGTAAETVVDMILGRDEG